MKRVLAWVSVLGLLLGCTGLATTACSIVPPRGPDVASREPSQAANDGAVDVYVTLAGIGQANIEIVLSGPQEISATSNTSGHVVFSPLAYGTYRILVKSANTLATFASGEALVNVTSNATQAIEATLHSIPGYSGSVIYLAVTSIDRIQGKSHTSPYVGELVQYIPGIIIATREHGSQGSSVRELWIQNPYPDLDPETSEGLYVQTTRGAGLNQGDFILIKNTYVTESTENYPGGSYYKENLSRTQVSSPYGTHTGTTEGILKLATNQPIPPPVILGETGRKIPSSIFSEGSVSGPFQPQKESLDFFESLESMRVQIPNPIIAGHTDEYNSTAFLPDSGLSVRNRADDGLPILNDANAYQADILYLSQLLKTHSDLPRGARLSGPIVGIVDYRYRSFVVQLTENLPAFTETSRTPLSTIFPNSQTLTVASFNLMNLAPANAENGNAGRIQAIAKQIVTNLNGPDILGLIEVQDNSGNTIDNRISGSKVFEELTAEINLLAPGRFDYGWTSIDPMPEGEGGEPGGNIRTAILFNKRRVEFVETQLPDYPNFEEARTYDLSVEPVKKTGGIGLTFSPGRLDPANPVWNRTRIPLAAEFVFQGKRLIFIVNHWTSKGGDSGWHTNIQPPVRSSDERRIPQARYVADWVADAMKIDPTSKIILVGDFNDQEYSNSISALTAVGLRNLVMDIDPKTRYSYVYNGYAQVLDHIIVSPNLAALRTKVEYLHLNTYRPVSTSASDHDPIIASIDFATSASSGGLLADPAITVEPSMKALNVTVTGQGLSLFGATVRSDANEKLNYCNVLDDLSGSIQTFGTIAHPLKDGSVSFRIPLSFGAPSNMKLWYFAQNTSGSKSRLLSSSFALRTTPRLPASDLFISEVVEGSSYNKAVEIANFTGSAVDLSIYSLARDYNGDSDFANAGRTRTLSGLLAHGATYILVNSQADPILLSKANVSVSGTTSALAFNGDDQLVLKKSGTIVDRFGSPSHVSGKEFAKDTTFIRSSLVSAPTINDNDPRETSNWTIFAKDYFSNLGAHEYDP